MSAQRNPEGPRALRPDDPGHQGENYGLGTRRSTAQFAAALKRAGHVAAPDDASTLARNHLLAVLAEQGRR